MAQGKGMDFARRMMEKCGWSEGKGLGRDEGGITEAIRPKLKFDTTGFNYNKADEFNFHWWDHVFNKAADNITVHKNQDDVVHISRSRELEVSTKRPSKKHARDHSGFIKGKTQIGQCAEVAGMVESSDDEEEERDRSLKLTDDQLFRMCEGRTAHKGARHGLNMTAKLARVKEQDRKLMEAWNKSADNLVKEEKIYSEENLVKKKKKKKRGVDNDLDQMPQEAVEDNDEKILVTQEEKMPRREKKSKKRHQQEKEEETEATNTEDSIKVKKKKKKKRNRETGDIKEESIGSESIENCRTKKIKSEWQSSSINEEEIICGKICTTEKKKKKKGKEGVNENDVANNEENTIVKNEKENCPVDEQVFSEFIPEGNATDGKKKSKSRKNKEGDLSMSLVSDECVQEYQRKKKKKKKSKDKIEGLL